MFSDEQTMLCLAGISYRGFYKSQFGPFDFDILRPPIERGLSSLAPLRGRFEIVWGPVHYRSALSVLDEKFMYVVRDLHAPRRYVVVVRGTNPISLGDWLFGDLWTGQQMRWRYGSGAERVSLSAALGLSIMRGLRSAGPRRSAAAARLWAKLDERIAALRQATSDGFGPFRAFGAALFDPLQRALLDALQRLGQVRTASEQPLSQTRLLEYVALWRSGARALLFDVVERIAELAGDDLDRALLALIERDAMLRSSLGSGATLQAFLAAAVEDAGGPLEVFVAGHSKGGALASTLALWLAETQGREGPADERWDPERRAVVHCFSFAGPTAGNAPFARRSDTLLGFRCRRVWNDMDIVPLAWDSEDLVKVPSLYLPQIGRLEVVDRLVELLVRRVGALSYRQIGGSVRRLHGDIAADKPFFFAQLAHQHLDAYLLKLDLAQHGISQAVLFGQPAHSPRASAFEP